MAGDDGEDPAQTMVTCVRLNGVSERDVRVDATTKVGDLAGWHKYGTVDVCFCIGGWFPSKELLILPLIEKLCHTYGQVPPFIEVLDIGWNTYEDELRASSRIGHEHVDTSMGRRYPEYTAVHGLNDPHLCPPCGCDCLAKSGDNVVYQVVRGCDGSVFHHTFDDSKRPTVMELKAVVREKFGIAMSRQNLKIWTHNGRYQNRGWMRDIQYHSSNAGNYLHLNPINHYKSITASDGNALEQRCLVKVPRGQGEGCAKVLSVHVYEPWQSRVWTFPYEAYSLERMESNYLDMSRMPLANSAFIGSYDKNKERSLMPMPWRYNKNDVPVGSDSDLEEMEYDEGKEWLPVCYFLPRP